MTPGEKKHSDSKDEVREILTEFASEQRDRRERRDQSRARPPGRRRENLLVGLAVVIAAVTVWVWVAPPAFLDPSALPETSAAEIETGLRMDMYGVVASLRRHQAESGRLPSSLDRALADPEEGSDILYTRLSDTRFLLVGARQGARIQYDSGEPISNLLGSAPDRLRPGREEN